MRAPLKAGAIRSAALPTAEGRVAPASEERDRMVRAEQVKLLYTKAPMAVAAILVNAPILVFILWDEVRHAALVGWLIYTVVLSLGRVWLTHEYWRRPPSPIEDSHWGIWYLSGIALSGLGWGAVGVFLFSAASLPHQLFIAFVLAGMTAGSVAACSAMMVGFLLFAVPVLIPLAIQFLAQGDDLHLAMGGMTTLYAVLLVFIARTMNQTIITSLNLRFENRDLVAYLTDALAKIKILRGLLPICSHCKKIRDDNDRWHTVEAYMTKHTEADFTHGICPECLHKLYASSGED